MRKQIAKAKKAVKRAVKNVEQMVKVEHPAPPPSRSQMRATAGSLQSAHYDNRPPEAQAEHGFSGNPNEAILDNLAGIANRVDDWLAHGPGFNLENRLRARLATPGLREWVKARLGS